MVSVENLSLEFGPTERPVKILRDVSLKARAGRFLTIVGESGCGKSMTAHSIIGLQPEGARITSGRITLPEGDSTIDLLQLEQYGKRMRSIRGKRLGMVFQDTMSSLNPVHTVGRQVAEKLLTHTDLSKREARGKVTELFGQLGIPSPDERFDQYPHEFSGGMRQRVMIAMALINKPDLLIADEPTTALDVTIQAQIMDLLKRIAREQQKAVILITHNMGLVAQVADEVAVMYMGRVVEVGPRDEVFLNPAHPYTRALMASVPTLNMPRDTTLTTIPGSTPMPSEVGSIGCSFTSRCPFATPECLEWENNDVPVGPGHFSKCRLSKQGI
ncbi:MAG: ABC transporter ATP-binding protein [Actinomycetaceae bacterium]|nr:ABC transporter ATP-binding protein [Actinomycetaceae bacterium]